MTLTRDDDDLEVELVDDRPDPRATTVDLRPRRRGRELLLVLVAVAVVAGVGLIGDTGDDDAVAAPTTTTTRRVGRPPPHPSATTPPTTRAPRPTTTTIAWPQHEAGAGPLLPGEPTGGDVAVISSSGVVTMIDLDTGDRCRTQPSREGGWLPWNAPMAGGRMLIQTNRSMVAIDRSCTMTDVGVNVNNAYPSAVGPDTVWIATEYGSPTLFEVDVVTGEETGRTVEVPRFNAATVLVVGDDVLLGVMGDMTLVDPDTGERRALGSGTPFAASGDLVAFATCPEARCRLGLLDVRSGERRDVRAVEPVLWDQAAFSPDGRLLRLAVPGSNPDMPASGIVDLSTGSMRLIDEPLQQSGFTADNRWLIGNREGRIMAYRVDGSVEDVELAEDLRGVQGLALL